MVAASARRQEILNKMAENQNIFAYPLDVTQKENVTKTFNNIIEDFKM